jgi:MFS transporter, FSR family, fosmidomycin resistance protein
MSLITAPVALPSVRSEAAVIAIVGFAHASSHFFHLMLPPLFPWLIKDFGLGFAQVGSLMTVFFVVSGIGQAVAGVWVDKFGSHRVLCAGLALLSMSGLCIFFASGLPAIYVAAALAGLGNSVFHPADFALLNKRVSPVRLGHAFSVHGLSGNLGWAAAPILMTAVASVYGWRAAGLCAALVGSSALCLLLWKKELMQYPLVDSIVRHGKIDHSQATVSTWKLLRSTVVLLAFGFFFFVTFGFGALQNFAPSLLGDIYGLSIAAATSALSIYLLAGCGGLLIGGFMVSGKKSLEYLVVGALLVAVLIALLLGWGVAPSALAVPLMGTMGFFIGLAGPSRDMLVRTAAKAKFGEAAFGRVYGFVYSGLDVGLALAPIMFGFLLDQRRPDLVFVGIAVTLFCAIVAALFLGRQSTKLQAH